VRFFFNSMKAARGSVHNFCYFVSLIPLLHSRIFLILRRVVEFLRYFIILRALMPLLHSLISYFEKPELAVQFLRYILFIRAHFCQSCTRQCSFKSARGSPVICVFSMFYPRVVVVSHLRILNVLHPRGSSPVICVFSMFYPCVVVAHSSAYFHCSTPALY
jgi:hypothetical protein